MNLCRVGGERVKVGKKMQICARTKRSMLSTDLVT